MSIDLRPLLPQVQKPARYIGGEINQVVKSGEGIDVRFALCFPDVYEIGMSYPGLQILYSILNNLPWCAAERCFSVWRDMEDLMRKGSIPLFSLESRTKLKDFDIAGFSLHHELSYTQVLAMLDLAGIPLRSADRKEGDPLVIAGGPCTLNPEPLALFFDAFFIGDGEDGVVEIAGAVREWKRSGHGRDELLKRLSKIDGVYIPSFYDITYNGVAVGSVTVREGAPEKVGRRVVPDLNEVFFPAKQLVSLLSPVHDRLVIEIQRGCTRGCRFCHAGIAYRPTRMRSVQKVLEIAEEGLKSTGFDELSFLSLSAGDYPPLSALLFEFMKQHSGDRVSLSLPSMRVETLEPALVEEIKKVRKTGFTIAPEAATQRLRDVINKGNTEEDLFRTVEATFEAGWSLIKLYFMVGLPTETEEDADAIWQLVGRVMAFAKKIKRGARFNVSVSTFVPKAHTPFQWEGYLETNEMSHRLYRVRQNLRRFGINASTNPPEKGFVEAVLARGDRRLAPVLEEAFKRGARLESWSENFSMRLWEEILNGLEGVTAHDLAGPRRFEDRLAWDHIDSGVEKGFLISEAEKAKSGERTEDCAFGACSACGVCTPSNGIKPVVMPAQAPVPELAAQSTREPSGSVPSILRVRYSRSGPLAYLGHLDIMGLWIQSARRSGLPVEYSQGFHPKAKLAFGPACPVGVESSVEYLDIVLKRKVDPGRALSMLNGALVSGLRAEETWALHVGAVSLSPSIASITYRFEFEREDVAKAALLSADRFLKSESCVVTRVKDGKSREFDVRSSVVSAGSAGEFSVDVIVRNEATGSAKLAEVFEHVFGVSREPGNVKKIERVAVSFK